ncbi:MAG: hypothetical protein H7A55_00055 [Verrucomicrobiaceae bacterium]|nr:hypothetical protein [Verrucomicrobiaceae bacterium]
MKTTLCSLATLLLLATAHADPAHPQVPTPLGQTGQWEARPAFSDEFDGGEVDARKWTTKVASWGPWTWEEKNAVQKDGKLILSMTYEPHARKNGQSLSYKSGIFRSKLKRTYGYYEARIKGCSLFPEPVPRSGSTAMAKPQRARCAIAKSISSNCK